MGRWDEYPATERFLDKVQPEPNTGCWLWEAGQAGNGYGYFYLHRYRKLIHAHRAAYELFVGKIPLGFDICHRCDVKLCVNPDHLFAGTRSDNMQDARQKGRLEVGERRWSSKLTADAVRDIRRRLDGPRGTKSALAREYGVSAAVITGIANGTRWAHVE